MVVIDLKKNLGLPLSFDGAEIVAQEAGIDVGNKDIVKISDMRPQLLNPDLSCPVIFYRMYSNVDRKSLLKRKNLRMTIVVIPQNLAGIEYVKTKGMNSGNLPILIDVVYGFVTVVLQSNTVTSKNENVTTLVIKMKKGQKFVIPPRTDFMLVNARQSTSITAMISSTKGRISDVFQDTRGGALYIIRKNARQEIVQNPYYRDVVHKRPCKPEEVYTHFGLTAKTPIFKQIMRKYDRFRWLHDRDKIDWDTVPTCRL